MFVQNKRSFIFSRKLRIHIYIYSMFLSNSQNTLDHFHINRFSQFVSTLLDIETRVDTWGNISAQGPDLGHKFATIIIHFTWHILTIITLWFVIQIWQLQFRQNVALTYYLTLETCLWQNFSFSQNPRWPPAVKSPKSAKFYPTNHILAHHLDLVHPIWTKFSR